MPQYLIVNRPPAGYRPSPDLMIRWNAWFDGLGERLVDRGNPVFARKTLGSVAQDGSVLGGYTLVTADDLAAAVQLAQSCPVLAEGGGVEVGELTALNNGRGPADRVHD